MYIKLSHFAVCQKLIQTCNYNSVKKPLLTQIYHHKKHNNKVILINAYKIKNMYVIHLLFILHFYLYYM